MNSTSASLYGSCPRPGGVAWRRDEGEGALAQPPTAAAARQAAIASRHCLRMTAYRNRFAIGVVHTLWEAFPGCPTAALYDRDSSSRSALASRTSIVSSPSVNVR